MDTVQSGQRNRTNVLQDILKRVAEAEGVSPGELSPPLYEVIDPDAVNRLFGNAATAARRERKLFFTYNGYEVTVNGDGNVTVV